MKKFFCLLALAALLPSVCADEVLFNDTFKSSKRLWRRVGTRSFAPAGGGILNVETKNSHMRYVGGALFPAGSRYRVDVKCEGKFPYKVGIFTYQNKKARFHFSDQRSGSSSFELVLPRHSYNHLVVAVNGIGKYRQIKLTRIHKKGYQVVAVPAYQMAKTPQPVKFVLLKDGKTVADAKLVSDGMVAAHPESGAYCIAYADKKDPAEFEKLAAKVPLRSGGNILYLGDSLTHFDMGHNHVDKVQYFLDKVHPGKIKFYNYACGGDYCERVMQRFAGRDRSRYRNRYRDIWSRKYAAAFVFLGHNDTRTNSSTGHKLPLMNPQKQEKYLSELIKLLQSKGIKRIIFVSTTSSNFELTSAKAARLVDAGRRATRFGDPVMLEKYNSVTQKLVRKYALEYLDLYTPMKSRRDKAQLVRPTDGVHLTDKGHDFVALETLKYLGGKGL